MRVLFLMRGAPGVGKSTFIKNNGLEQYALSADEIRLLIQSPTLGVDGSLGINQANDKRVWQLLFTMLEDRMRRGELTVIDATNSKTAEMSRYKKMADQHRYRLYVIDFTGVPIETVKERNRQRPDYKFVPEAVIDNMYARFEAQNIPAGIKPIKPEEVQDLLSGLYSKRDFSEYKVIHHIGDIHGCYQPLIQYFDNHGGVKDDELYIFVGDYMDRGVQNAEMAQFLIDNYKRKNFIFLTGNHEDHLRHFVRGEESANKEFELVTKPQLLKADLNRKELRQAVRSMGQFAHYTYNGKEVMVTHGGLSCIVDNMIFVSTQQMINGVGKYPDMEEVNASFLRTTEENVFQIHGHRNDGGAPVQINERCFNLCGDVEFGGCLRTVRLDETGFTVELVQNEVFSERKKFDKLAENKTEDISIDDLVALLRDSKYVKESQFDHISSFNFSSSAFKNKVWNQVTTRARGLFINTKKNTIVARSYDKFFNMNEVEATRQMNLQHTLQFPLRAYVKYNGFLGIVGYDEETDDLAICSKSSVDSDHAGWFKDVLNMELGENMGKLKENRDKLVKCLKERNLSLIFEVIDPANDPHIIGYTQHQAVLLDAVYRDLKCEKLSYDELMELAEELNLPVKELAAEFYDWYEFYQAQQKWQDPAFLYNGEPIEGFVLEDEAGFMFKLKLNYYNMWKFLRSIKDEVKRKGHTERPAALSTAEMNEFYGFVRSLPKEELEQDIIALRGQFYAQRKQKAS